MYSYICITNSKWICTIILASFSNGNSAIFIYLNTNMRCYYALFISVFLTAHALTAHNMIC